MAITGEEGQHLQNRFSPQVEDALLASGWFPGRSLPDEELEKWFVLYWEDEHDNLHFTTRIFSAALHALREFGGLDIEQSGPGVTCARTSFCFDPIAAAGCGSIYNWLCDEWMADSILYPLGVLYPLGYCKEQGDPFVINMQSQILLTDPGLRLIGNNVDRAIENLIIGIMPERFEVEVSKIQEAATVFPTLRKQNRLRDA